IFFMGEPYEGRSIDELMILLPDTSAWTTIRQLIGDPRWLVVARQRDAVALEAFFMKVLTAEPADAQELLNSVEANAFSTSDVVVALTAVELLIVGARQERAATACQFAVSRFGASITPAQRFDLLLLQAEALLRDNQLGRALTVLTAAQSYGSTAL